MVLTVDFFLCVGARREDVVWRVCVCVSVCERPFISVILSHYRGDCGLLSLFYFSARKCLVLLVFIYDVFCECSS